MHAVVTLYSLFHSSFIQFFSLGTFVALAVALAGNALVTLPETSSFDNISVDINILGGPFLQRSVNIFGGIFIALTAICLIFTVAWMVLMTLNVAYINKNIHNVSRIVSLLIVSVVVCVAYFLFQTFWFVCHQLKNLQKEIWTLQHAFSLQLQDPTKCDAAMFSYTLYHR